MPNNNLTDLLPDWHPIPDGGGLVRKGERYAIVESEGRTISIYTSEVDWTMHADGRVLTEHPITPPLPTEEGVTIVVSGDDRPPRILLTRLGDCWVNQYVVEWPADRIRAWAPVTIGETVIMR